MKISNEMKLFR